MGCCNQAPKGGTRSMGLLLKMVGVMFAIVICLAWLSS